MNIQDIFLDMQNMEKGVLIDNPHSIIITTFKISDDIANILKTFNTNIYFTRLSMKHLAEKGEAGRHIFNNIKDILEHPDAIHLGNFFNRYLISKQIIFSSNEKAHGVVLEVIQEYGNIIVTGFVAKPPYFKNLKLLWGTTFSPSQQPPKK